MTAEVGLNAERGSHDGAAAFRAEAESEVIRALEHTGRSRSGGQAQSAQPRHFAWRQAGDSHRGPEADHSYALRPGREHRQGDVEDQGFPSLSVDFEGLDDFYRQWFLKSDGSVG